MRYTDPPKDRRWDKELGTYRGRLKRKQPHVPERWKYWSPGRVGSQKFDVLSLQQREMKWSRKWR